MQLRLSRGLIAAFLLVALLVVLAGVLAATSHGVRLFGDFWPHGQLGDFWPHIPNGAHLIADVWPL